MGEEKDDDKKYGEPSKYDPSFNGPIKNRSCTDVICCILFLIFFLGMLAVGAFAYLRGDPTRLLYPTDSQGNLCGQGDYADKPNLFFFDLLDCAKLGVAVAATGCPTPQVCLEKCPSTYWMWAPQYAQEVAAEKIMVPNTSGREKMICIDGVNAETSTKVCVKDCPSKYWVWATQYATETAGGNSDGRSDMICKDNVNAQTSSKVCVDRCPSKKFAWPIAAANASYRKALICKPHIKPEVVSRSVQELVEDEDCAAYYVESTPIVGRCVPAIFAEIAGTVGDILTDQNDTVVDKFGNAVNGTFLEEGTKYLAYFLNVLDYGSKIFQDVRASWWLILVALVIASLLSFIWIVLMRWIAAPMVWLTIIAFLALFGFEDQNPETLNIFFADMFLVIARLPFCSFLGISMLVSFIWIIIMRWIAAPMVWITLIVFVALFGFATYYSFDKYFNMKDDPQYQGSYIFTTNLSYYTNLASTWLALGIIAAVLLGIILLVLIFLRKRILIAIALIKEASRAVGSMIFTLFWPIIPFLFQIILFGYWGASAIFLASMGSMQYQASNKTVIGNTSSDENITTQQEVKNKITEVIEMIPCDAADNGTEGSVCQFLKYGGDEYTIYLQVFQLFMLFWCMNFIIALGQMVLAGAFASYYWAFTKPKDIPAFPVTYSLGRTFRYHLGSIAFGSLIIAIIQIIRVGLEYLDSKLKGSENRVAKFFLKCLKCCFWCLEKFMKFLNKNAYILIAVYGKNFCTSAKNAFFLILRNIVRVAVVDKVTDFLLFIGKLVVVGAVGTLAFFFFSGRIEDAITSESFKAQITAFNPSLNYYLVPVIVIAIGSYVIAAGFFSVYGMGVDTMFLCFLEDLERNDGSAEKPYYMSKELKGILGKKNKKPEAEKKED